PLGCPSCLSHLRLTGGSAEVPSGTCNLPCSATRCAADPIAGDPMRHALLLLLASGCAGAACPPASHDQESLTALRESGFAISEAAARDTLAIELLDCLASPDPHLRDRIAFEGTATWLRAGLISLDARQQMLDALLST